MTLDESPFDDGPPPPDDPVRLREQEQAWSLLDHLPRTSVGAEFASRTVEMIAQSDEQAAQESARRRARTLRRLALVTAVLTGALGFAAARWLGPRDDERLLADLPLLVQLDAYRGAAQVDFLRELADSKLLADELETSPPPPLPGDDSAARRQFVLDMTAAQRESLRARRDRLASLSVDEQHRLRALAAELTADPRRDELLATLARYQAWRQTLPPADFAKLEELPVAGRLDFMRTWQKRLPQREEWARLLGPKESQVVAQWLREYVEQRRTDMREFARSQRPVPPGRALRPGVPMTIWCSEGMLDPEDYRKLRSLLPGDVQKVMDRPTTDPQRGLLVMEMSRAAARHVPMMKAILQGGPPPIVRDDLKQELGSLPEAEYQQLLDAPADEALDRLAAKRRPPNPGPRFPPDRTRPRRPEDKLRPSPPNPKV